MRYKSLARCSINMKSFLILVCVALIGFSTAEELNQNGLHKLEQQNCGVFNDGDLSLTNNEVKVGTRPWMALIKVDKFNHFVCMGTLISDRFVMTAAHCVKDFAVKSVRLGEHDMNCATSDKKKKCLSSVEDIDVERVIIHEDFVGSPGTHDIALLQLARKVDFKEHINPICLPLNAELQQKAESLESMLLTGWGADHEPNSISVLREIELGHLDRENCSQSLKGIKIEPSHICSYGSDILCRGTSGNPMSKPLEFMGKQRFVQFGIVSFGETGCRKSSAAVSTNVGSFMPWITRILGA